MFHYNWNLSIKSIITAAVLWGSSSWITCPTLLKTLKTNFPCIWAIVNSLSNLSVPASNNNFGDLIFKNNSERPLYQPYNLV